MTKIEEIQERLDAASIVVNLIVLSAVSHRHELPKLDPGLVVDDLKADFLAGVPEYDPAV